MWVNGALCRRKEKDVRDGRTGRYCIIKRKYTSWRLWRRAKWLNLHKQETFQHFWAAMPSRVILLKYWNKVETRRMNHLESNVDVEMLADFWVQATKTKMLISFSISKFVIRRELLTLLLFYDKSLLVSKLFDWISCSCRDWKFSKKYCSPPHSRSLFVTFASSLLHY